MLDEVGIRCSYLSELQGDVADEMPSFPLEVALSKALTSRTLKRNPRRASSKELLPSDCPPIATISGMGNSSWTEQRETQSVDSWHRDFLCF
jgi:hypothetical protein